MGSRELGEHQLTGDHRSTGRYPFPLPHLSSSPGLQSSVQSSGCHYLLVLQGGICIRQMPLLLLAPTALLLSLGSRQWERRSWVYLGPAPTVDSFPITSSAVPTDWAPGAPAVGFYQQQE